VADVRDADLYQRILGISLPWTVARVDLDVSGKKVDVWLEHDEKALWPCPQCPRKPGLYDHKEERVWRHLDTMQFQTFVHARMPRVNCPDHGVRQVEVAWAEPHSHFTSIFEWFAIDVIQETDTQGAGKILKLSWDEAWGIQERAVARGLTAKRYCLFARDKNGRPHAFRKSASDHGLGVFEAEGEREEFVAGVWEAILAHGKDAADLYPGVPATARFSLSSPALLPRVRRLGPIRPFAFLTARFLEPSPDPTEDRS